MELVMLFQVVSIAAILLVLAATGGQGADVPSSEAIRPTAHWHIQPG
jgi:hypothetical protein